MTFILSIETSSFLCFYIKRLHLLVQVELKSSKVQVECFKIFSMTSVNGLRTSGEKKNEDINEHSVKLKRLSGKEPHQLSQLAISFLSLDHLAKYSHKIMDSGATQEGIPSYINRCVHLRKIGIAVKFLDSIRGTFSFK